MKNSETHDKTSDLLLNHCKTYPMLQIQDVFKFLYQSAFGCEHMISSMEDAIEGIGREYERCCAGKKLPAPPHIIPLDGNYSRVSLSYLQNRIPDSTFANGIPDFSLKNGISASAFSAGLSAATLGKLFFYSAKKEPDGMSTLLKKIEIARELANAGILPFSKEEFHEKITEWEANGYPAVHHSEAFRESYHPAYRVIANEYIPLLPFLAGLEKRLTGDRLVVAIDGNSASGKTTLCTLLEKLYDCTVFHMDDFFLQAHQRTPERMTEVGGNLDRERFISEVLQPLQQGTKVTYRKFNCSTMSLGEFETVFPKRLVILEGVYSMHPAFSKYIDYSLFLDLAPKLQRERILRRNSHELADKFFNLWIPMEDRYFKEMNVMERCDIRISIS